MENFLSHFGWKEILLILLAIAAMIGINEGPKLKRWFTRKK